jgi:hypothetical protein
MNSLGDRPRVYAGVGQESAPSMTFGAEPVTGAYLENPGPNSSYSISKRGTKRLRVTDTGVDVKGILTADNFIPSGLSLLPDGSATAPSLAFTSSTSSGTYWDTAGTAGQAWSSNGTKKMKVTPTSLTVDTDVTCGTNSMTTGALNCSSIASGSTVRGTIGTDSAPTFSWSGHTTSGMYWDTLSLGPAISRQGVERLSFGSTSALFNTTVQVPDGSSAFPAIAFSSDPTLGLRHSIPTGTFAICNNNSDIFEFGDSTGFNTFGRDINTGTGSITGSAFAPTVVRTFDGTFSGPTHSFQNETTMGMYRSSADVLALTNGTGITPSLSCNSTGTTVRGTVLADDGSSSAPAFSFSSQPAMGFARGGSNILNMYSGGTAASLSTTGLDVLTGRHLSVTGDLNSSSLTCNNDLMVGGNGYVVADLKAGAFQAVGDGSLSGPKYYFQNDAKMGMYRAGSGQLAFTYGTGATNASLIMSSTGSNFSSNVTAGNNVAGNSFLGAGSGTLSAPVYSFASETKMGMYRVGSAQLGFSYGVGATAPSLTMSSTGSAFSDFVSSKRVWCRLGKLLSNSQSVTNGVTAAIIWNSQDTAGGTNSNWTFVSGATVTVPYAGLYSIFYSVGTTVTGAGIIWIEINGSAARKFGLNFIPSNGTTVTSCMDYQFAANDTFQVIYLNQTGSTVFIQGLDLTTSFVQATRISE